MTFKPTSWASSAKLRAPMSLLSLEGSFALPSASILSAMSMRPCFAKCDMRPGLAPWSTMNVVASFQSFGAL